MGFDIMNDPYGYSVGLIEPMRPADLPVPDLEKIYLHPGESPTAFKWIVQRINSLMSGTLFTPDYMNDVFLGKDVTDEDLHQFGTGEINPYKATVMSTNGIGNPWDDARGFNDQLFGYAHPQIDSFGAWWGTGTGIAGKKSFKNNYSAADDNVFKGKPDSFTADFWMDDPTAYKNMVMPQDSGFGDYRAYLTDMKNLLGSGNLAGKSYYEIVMSGINSTGISYSHHGDGTDTINYGATQWGSYAYDGMSDKDWFLLMTSMVRARRKFTGTMAELFGSTSLIYNDGGAPDDQAMIKTQESWLKNNAEGGGAHYNNKAFLLMFAQGFEHYFRGLNAAYSGNADYVYDGGGSVSGEGGLGDAGFNGLIRTARDLVAFKRFRNLIRSHAANYVHQTGDANAANLYQEFTYSDGRDDTPTYNLPFGKNSDWTASATVGWDAYSNPIDPGNPFPNANPLTVSGNHSNYALAQIEGLDSNQIKGMSTVNGKNLFKTNWVVHIQGRLTRFKERATTEPPTVNMLNFGRYIQYNENKTAYRQKEREIKDKIAEQRQLDAKADAKAIQRNKQFIKKATKAPNKKKDNVKAIENKDRAKVHNNKKEDSNVARKRYQQFLQKMIKSNVFKQ